MMEDAKNISISLLLSEMVSLTNLHQMIGPLEMIGQCWFEMRGPQPGLSPIHHHAPRNRLNQTQPYPAMKTFKLL